MSFASDVKDELARQLSQGRHCQLAEMAAILILCGKVSVSARGDYCLRLYAENPAVIRKMTILLKKAFRIRPESAVRVGARGNNLYMIGISDREQTLHLLQAVRLLDAYGEVRDEVSLRKSLLLQKECCRRSFLRGAFLAAGTMSNPENSYHFEIALRSEQLAEEIAGLIRSFDIPARVTGRKKQYIVYIKDSSAVVDMLGIMEAHVSLMELENVRILKEMRNSVNRQVNCETANLHKTVSAGLKQIEDITYLRSSDRYAQLPESLREIAELREQYPDASLKELGEMMDPPIGKSGVNHRLRRIAEIVEKGKEGRL